MNFLGFIVCVIFVCAYLAVCYEDSDKRKFEKRWDHIQKTGGFTNYNRDGSLKHEDYPCQNLSEHMRNKYDEMKRDGRL